MHESWTRSLTLHNTAQHCTTLHVAAGPACNHSKRGGGSRIRNSRPPGLTVILPSQKQTNSNGVRVFLLERNGRRATVRQSKAWQLRVSYSRLRAGQLAITKTKNRQRGRFHEQISDKVLYRRKFKSLNADVLYACEIQTPGLQDGQTFKKDDFMVPGVTWT